MSPGLGLAGLVLAAGDGSRLGMPKALVLDEDGNTWLARTVKALTDAGVTDVLVVVGAQTQAVRAAVPSGCHVVEAADWHQGMSASLRAGIRAATARADLTALLVMLVDIPDVGPAVVRRLATLASRGALARAGYEGAHGHPVLLGRDHWQRVIETAGGDRGARDYLSSRDTVVVECGDLASGVDVDTPEMLADWRRRARGASHRG
jgi:molybdenum cofactor cytidylyltransferase/nicotine blue oxidoreductase